MSHPHTHTCYFESSMQFPRHDWMDKSLHMAQSINQSINWLEMCDAYNAHYTSQVSTRLPPRIWGCFWDFLRSLVFSFSFYQSIFCFHLMQETKLAVCEPLNICYSITVPYCSSPGSCKSLNHSKYTLIISYLS